MGFRFQRSVRILPFLRLNFSRDGVSASFGRHGANVRIGRRGARGTIGIPGTGLSYSTSPDPSANASPSRDQRPHRPYRPARRSGAIGYGVALLLVAFLAGISIALAWP